MKQEKLPYIMIMKNKNAKKGEDASYTIVEECENHEKQELDNRWFCFIELAM